MPLLGKYYSQIAQLAELRTVNPLVVGSSPTLGAMTKPKYQISEEEFKLLYKQLYKLLESSTDSPLVDYVCQLIEPMCNHFNLLTPNQYIFFKL